jgi:hypothetical protein
MIRTKKSRNTQGDEPMPDLEALLEENAAFSSQNSHGKRYRHDINARLTKAESGFAKALGGRDQIQEYETPLRSLIEAESFMAEARDRKCKIDIPYYQSCLDGIKYKVRNSYNGSRAFLSYVQGSRFDLSDIRERLEARMRPLADLYASSTLHRSRKEARRLRRSFKVETDLMMRLCDDLAQLDGIEAYGVDISAQVCQIRETAYLNGVLFVVEMAQHAAESGDYGRAQGILVKAKRNATILKRDDILDDIERMDAQILYAKRL